MLKKSSSWLIVSLTCIRITDVEATHYTDSMWMYWTWSVNYIRIIEREATLCVDSMWIYWTWSVNCIRINEREATLCVDSMWIYWTWSLNCIRIIEREATLCVDCMSIYWTWSVNCIRINEREATVCVDCMWIYWTWNLRVEVQVLKHRSIILVCKFKCNFSECVDGKLILNFITRISHNFLSSVFAFHLKIIMMRLQNACIVSGRFLDQSFSQFVLRWSWAVILSV